MPKDGDSAFQIARSIFDSDVWSGDIHMAKLWIYLLGKAQFRKNSPEQGTLTTSLRRIQQDNSYLDPGGIIKRFWSIHKIVNMLEDLEKTERIVCKGTPKGTFINIIKYRDYQNLSNYKGTPKGKQRGHRRDTAGTLTPQDSSIEDTSTTPKNVKNVKNVKNKPTTIQKKKIYFDFNKEIWENITDKDKNSWREAYPACDIELEIKQMKEWLLSNPDKKKSRYRRFITNWFSRSQEKGGTVNKQKEQNYDKLTARYSNR